MTGLLIRLAGPLQSWGEHSTFNDRDTLRFPTRSGLVGLLAAAEGVPRGASLDRYDALSFTVRIDRPGTPLTDFHTIGGGLPADRTPPTAGGGRRPAGKGTIVTRRTYLADAAFTVAVTGPVARVAELAAALHHPHWQPYLGRRSCPPDPPLLVRTKVADPVDELYGRVPLARRPPNHGAEVDVDFLYDQPPRDTAAAITSLNDVPVSFGRHDRRYRLRDVYRTTHQLPATMCAGFGRRYLEALDSYLRQEADP